MSARQERGWLPVYRAAEYVGVRADAVRAAVNAGELPAYRRRTSSARADTVLISVADLDAWVRSWPAATFGPRAATA